MCLVVFDSVQIFGFVYSNLFVVNSSSIRQIKHSNQNNNNEENKILMRFDCVRIG